MGFDLRCPYNQESIWSVGDFVYQDYLDSIEPNTRRIRQIISFDLNLSPRPWDVRQLGSDQFRLSLRCWATVQAMLELSHMDDPPTVSVFWEIERVGWERVQSMDWFEGPFYPTLKRPENWESIGYDLVNDDGVSELWDIDEGFWQLDPRLVESVNKYGLSADYQIIECVLPDLPLNPIHKWVTVWRAWIDPVQTRSSKPPHTA